MILIIITIITIIIRILKVNNHEIARFEFSGNDNELHENTNISFCKHGPDCIKSI